MRHESLEREECFLAQRRRRVCRDGPIKKGKKEEGGWQKLKEEEQEAV